MKFRIISIVATGIALLAGPAFAQAPAAPAPAPAPAAASNPLDVIPDAMPFSQPYGAPITLDHAKKLIAGVEAEVKKRGWAMNVTVVDSGGNLVAFERMDGAQIASIAISQHKARTAAKYRRPTKVFENAVQNGTLYVLTLDDVIASRGGFPLVENGKIIGAIGCSGGTGSQDEASCQVGADMVK
ncbi:MAG TPA: heme-binding protein [Stellaceae bacterium]|nr:heme-binding protein [Stellaceae bacterium]